MKTTEAHNSISSAVFALQDSLKGLQQQWTSLKKTDTSTPKEVLPNELHAFGMVNLDKVREDFSHHINLIRNVCSQFETEVLGDVMKMGAGADPAFRKHFTHLKEQAALETTVMRLKDTLKNTNEHLLNSLKEKEESKSKIETQRIEELARSLKLVPFVDSSQKFESGIPITTITLGGTVIVVDIDVDDTGHVQRTKVTYVSETLENDQDDRVDLMLAKNLQTRNFDLFKRNLGSLALMDQLNVKYAPTDFFQITKNLLDDLRSICELEMSMESDLSIVLLEGHGIPCLHLDYPGISINYWMDKYTTINTHWDEVNHYIQRDETHPILSKAHKLLISFEDFSQPIYYLPPSRSHYLLNYDDTEESVKDDIDGDHYKITTETTYPKFMSPMRFIKVLPTHPDIQPIPIRFVATLDPPLPASDDVCQRLMNIVGLSKQEYTTVTTSTECLSLEELLVMDVHNHKNDIYNNDHIEWASTLPDSPTQVYKLINSKVTNGKVLSRVPFHHPVQLYSILRCLRQQQTFNTLFQSIFNASSIKTKTEPLVISLSLNDIIAEATEDRKIRLQIVVIDAPSTIHITMAPPPSDNYPFMMLPFSVDIPADNPTQPRVHLHSPNTFKSLRWNTQILEEDKMTQVLQTAHDIPLLIRWIYRRMRSSDSYLVESYNKKGRSDDNEWSISSKKIKMELDDY
ncbi:mediator of RNA polymerase II transcription subunit 1-domain-containing protein [Pilobolus umbonatus]|nr:mediator of RNA polymerase II transcription subunit 1-domain-containing protein [Pilobolus umbonatus]